MSQNRSESELREEREFGSTQIATLSFCSIFIFVTDFLVNGGVYVRETSGGLVDYFFFCITFLASGMATIFSIAVGFCAALWRTRFNLTLLTAVGLSAIFVALFLLHSEFERIEGFTLVGFSFFSITAIFMVAYMRHRCFSRSYFLHLWHTGIVGLAICHAVFLILTLWIQHSVAPWEAQKGGGLLLLVYWIVFPIALCCGVRRGL